MLKSSGDINPGQDCLLLMQCLDENQNLTHVLSFSVCFPHLLNNLSAFPEHFLPVLYGLPCFNSVISTNCILFRNSA